MSMSLKGQLHMYVHAVRPLSHWGRSYVRGKSPTHFSSTLPLFKQCFSLLAGCF